MATTSPHVAVIVNHAKEMSQLLDVLRSLQSQNRFHFLWLWFNAFFGEKITQVFEFVFSKEALLDIRPKTKIFQSGQYRVKFSNMVLKGAIRGDQDVVNVDPGVVEIAQEVVHNTLENVWRGCDAHW